MNGEVGLAARLTAAARKAIKGGEFKFERNPYEKMISFIFAEKKTVNDNEREIVADTPEAWFEKLKNDGVTEVFMVMPLEVKDRTKLGFVNTSGCTIFARFASGKVSRYVHQWIPDTETRKWNIIYREDVLANPPAASPRFKDPTESFKNALLNAAKLAEKLGTKMFGDMFMKGYYLLDGGDFPTEMNRNAAPDLPEKHMRLYLAADISDVFGANGSWNDGPSIKAGQMGIYAEYDKISEALLAYNRLAVQYAINED